MCNWRRTGPIMAWRRRERTFARCRCRSGRKRPSSRRPVVERAVLVLDDDGAVVRAHARLGQWQRGLAKGAFGGDAADQPLGASATRAVIDLMLAINSVVP